MATGKLKKGDKIWETLWTAGEYIRDNHAKAMVDDKTREHFQSEMFTGYDFDNSMLRIGNINMVIAG